MPRRALGRSSQPASPREAELLALLTARERELAEARTQQDATAGVLRAMRVPPADRPAVLAAIAAAAGRLCPGAQGAIIFLVEGNTLRVGAIWNPRPGAVR